MDNPYTPVEFGLQRRPVGLAVRDARHDLDLFDLPDLALYLQGMLFARVQGRMEFCCPFCGYLNYATLRYRDSWRVRCNASDCRRTIAVGLMFYEMATGVKVPPADSIMPVEISREKWRSGQLVNRLVTTGDREASAHPDNECSGITTPGA